MNSLFIKQVEYSADSYYYKSPPFVRGLNIITGDNSSGKTTFSKLIYFVLGGTINEFYPESTTKQKEISDDQNGFVKIHLDINNNPYIFIRKLESKERNYVTILEENKKPNVLPINRMSNNYIFSDWILGKLDIPKFKIYQGAVEFYFGFNDILRLMYHDQLSHQHYVLKSPDGRSNYVNDSSRIRKTIFEVLTSNVSKEYYNIINKLKETDQQISLQSNKIKSLEKTTRSLSSRTEIRNEQAVTLEIQRTKEQISIIDDKINMSYSNNRNYDLSEETVKKLQSDLRYHYNRKSSIQREIDYSQKEIIRFMDFHEFQRDEINTLTMMMKTQEELQIIDSTKCPICGSETSDRESGHCICNSKINEEDFLNFFYSQKEHRFILESKMKAISTTEKAIESLENQLNNNKQTLITINENIKEVKSTLTKYLEPSNQGNNLKEVKTYINELKKFNLKLANLEKESELSKELQQEYKILDSLKTEKRIIQSKYAKIESVIISEMSQVIEGFSKIYNSFMTSYDDEILNAAINDDYEPTINNDEYTNAAKKVPRRLFYFLSLLKFSIQENIPFPRFLLIDTPRNFGIDTAKIKRIINQINDFSSGNIDSHQIIMTISSESIPENVKENVIQNIDSKLLIKKDK